ncbi:hypothetical protein EHYA_08820 [Embleya hyalina]|uniref:Uncharacterized protein n=1 Tax=Embleya hyalina TaxID=516124 RepID=A0A401Z2N5_9ACTN|nr:hypothetical protein EHYA_08820 [Embleya hyalina]
MISVSPSGDEVRPIRITAPGRNPLDVTRAELTALVHESRMYLMRTFPAPSVGSLSDSSG